MKRSHVCGERLDARESSSTVLAASMFAASVGMIWDLATGHVSAFDRIFSDLMADDRQAAENHESVSPAARGPRGDAANISPSTAYV